MTATDATPATAQAPATREHAGAAIPLPGTFVIDATHSTIGFVAKHLVVSKVRGHFAEFDGSITFAENPLESTATIDIQAASISTNEENRDNHLRTGDFLLVEEHPVITFRSTGVTAKGDGSYVLSGDLAIRGVTKSVDLAVDVEGVVYDPWGGERVAFSASTEIDRDEFGVSFNQALETGGVMISKKVRLELEVQAVRQA
jgi:polyisoprenoid-binding protein YceI